MKKRLNRKTSSAEPQVKPDMLELIMRMQQQLASLEKKVDTLLSRSEQGPSATKPFTKPFRRFEPSHNRAEAGYGHNRAESGYGQDRGERTLFRAICADCNTECEVPFRPNQGRPVYCKQCFSKRKGDSPFKSRFDAQPRHREVSPSHPFNKYMGGERHSEKRSAFKKRKR